MEFSRGVAQDLPRATSAFRPVYVIPDPFGLKQVSAIRVANIEKGILAVVALRHMCTLVTVLTLGIFLSGCGGSDAPDLVKAEGTVLYKDAPIPDAMVTFIIDGAPIANGSTNAEGKFVITTGGRPGAPLGSAKVGIAKMKVDAKPTQELKPEDMMNMITQGQTGSANSNASEIPLKYSDPKKSGLVATVEADAAKNVFEFRLNE